MPTRRFVLQGAAAGLAAGALSGCATPGGQGAPGEVIARSEPLGDFRLGHNIVTARTPTVGPLSRRATEEEWIAALTAAIRRELGGYEGSGLYHTGISVDGYTLALPGIPVVLSPKSVLIIGATVWDEKLGGKINQKPNQIVVFESLGAGTVVGSGLVRSKAEQMADLCRNAAVEVHRWMRDNAAWFQPA